jgi:hypothetical protein
MPASAGGLGRIAMLEKATIAVPCPGCGRKTPKTIGWMRSNETFACIECNAIVAVKAEEVITSFYRLATTARELPRAARGRPKRRVNFEF